MATKVPKGSLKRAFSTQAALDVSKSIQTTTPKGSQLPSGLFLASVDNKSPVAMASFLFKAGSRYETDVQGAAHMVQDMAGMSTLKNTGLKLNRFIEMVGGKVTAELGREYIRYNMVANKPLALECFRAFKQIATTPVFRTIELDNEYNLRRLDVDYRTRPNSDVALDYFHTAAYRTGLGNPLFVDKHTLKEARKPEVLREYHSSTHTVDNAMLVTIGFDHEDLVQASASITFPTGEARKATPSNYRGGDMRSFFKLPTTTVVIGGEGAKFGTQEAATYFVLKSLLGTGPRVQYSTGISKLLSIFTQAGGTGKCTPLNFNYSDSGLFGILIEEKSDKVSDVTTAIVKELRSLKVTDADFQVAKNSAKAELLMGFESKANVLSEIGLQTLFNKTILGPNDMAAAIDKVDVNALQKALTKTFSGKRLSIGAFGPPPDFPMTEDF